MLQPPSDRLGECRQTAATGRQIERHVEKIAPTPVALCVIARQNVDLRCRRYAEHRHEGRQWSRARAAEGFLVSADQRSFVRRESLRAKEELGSAEHKRVTAAIEGIAQNHVNELVEEERRRVADFPADEIEIGRLQRLVAQQMVAK